MTKPTSESIRIALRYLFKAEVEELKALANALPADPVVVNIGAGGGTSGMAFLEARPDLQLWTIDVQRESSPFGCLEAELQAAKAARLHGPRHHQVEGDSKAVGRDWEGLAVDLVFVDGDHSYEGCRGDILAWMPHLKPGGVIAVHDYDKSAVYDAKDRRGVEELAPHPLPWPGVDVAVRELLMQTYPLVSAVDTLVAFGKRNPVKPGKVDFDTAAANEVMMEWRHKRDPPLCCVVGMQRTGTTWLARLLADAFYVPSLSRDWTWDSPGVAKTDGVVHGLDRPGRGVRRAHWNANKYPYPESPVVAIVRDPRDQCVSSFHYYGERDLHQHSMWLVNTAAGYARDWNDWLRGWVQRGVPFVRYEDLHAYPLHTLRMAIKDMGLDVPPDADLKRAVHDNTFSVMEERGTKHVLMRKGTVGEWRTAMDLVTAGKVAEFCRPMMEKFGYV